MTLTFGFGGPTPGRSGPGAQLQVNIPSGPIPTDDYVTVTLTEISTGMLVCQGQRGTGGLLAVQVFLGYQERFHSVEFGRPDSPASGVAVQVHAYQWHANNTLVDQSIDTAWGVLDYTAFAWSLLWWVGGQGAVGEVLAAVKTTLPSGGFPL